MVSTGEKRFWELKSLPEMNQQEWESLCDGCAKCCLNKLEDIDTGTLYQTNVACELLDLRTCRCTDYSDRQIKVPDCIKITPDLAADGAWLPKTCSYRLLAENKPLPDWHPLICGDRGSAVIRGKSIAGKAIHESKAGELEDHLVDWESI